MKTLELEDAEVPLVLEALRTRAQHLRLQLALDAAADRRPVEPRVRQIWRDEAKRYGSLHAKLAAAHCR